MTDATAERWLPVPGWETYLVSDAGRVRGPRGGILRQVRRQDGYMQVRLHIRNVPTTRKVHRLVAAAFIGPCPEGLEVRHLDGDPANNHVSNLRYGTHSENVQDLLRHGRHPHASQTHCIHGHEFTEANTYMWRGIRHCRACVARRTKERYWRLKEARG